MIRTHYVLLLGLVALLGSCRPDVQSEPSQTQEPGDSLWIYVGTYTQGASEGIYRLTMDAETGALSEPVLVAKANNPSYLAIHPTGRFLYAVAEIGDHEGRATGLLSAYKLETNGTLTLLNEEETRGAHPCHVSLDSRGRYALVANYSGGSVAVFPIADDGRLEPASGFAQHEGASVDPRRQQAPHAHAIFFDTAEQRAYAADLGLDKILIYAFDETTGTIQPQAHASVPPGGGPRHFTFHPTKPLAFTNNEMTSSVTGFEVDPSNGALQPIQTISTLPADFAGSNSTAQILASTDGRFLYVSNRGHDSIAMFAVNQEEGTLTAMGHQSTMGQTPRNFNIDPRGRFLVAANQQSDTLVVFRIHPETGRLNDTGHRATIPSPVCVQFLASF